MIMTYNNLKLNASLHKIKSIQNSEKAKVKM